MQERNEVVIHRAGVSYVGPDAVALFRARCLESSIRLYLKTGIIPTRNVGVKRMCEFATGITKKPYPASRKGLTQAVEDLRTWAATMETALPVTEE